MLAVRRYGISFASTGQQAGGSGAERQTMRTLCWETLKDDIQNGALASVIIIAVVCLAIILFL